MTIQNEHELATTRRKLMALEQQLAEAKDRLDAGTPLSDWTLRSLRKFESHVADALRH